MLVSPQTWSSLERSSKTRWQLGLRLIRALSLPETLLPDQENALRAGDATPVPQLVRTKVRCPQSRATPSCLKSEASLAAVIFPCVAVPACQKYAWAARLALSE